MVFILLLVLPFASAEIVLDDFKDYYNKGEELSVSGTILRDEEIEGGSLKIVLYCNDIDFNLLTKAITVNAKEAKKFSTEPFTVPAAADGECYVKLSLLLDEAVLEEKDSELFNVSNELKASEEDFQVNPLQVQLGEGLTIYGYITSINDEPITGIATIYFKTEGQTYYINNVKIIDGRLEYSYKTLDNKPGEYYVDVDVKDLYGNRKVFEDVVKFSIVDEVHIFVEPIYKKIIPGSTVHLAGKVNSVLGDEIKDGTLQIIFGNEIFPLDIKDGKFEYDLQIPENIEAGKHKIMFSFVDKLTGNWGSTDRTIYVEAVPTELKLNILYNTLKPEESLELIVSLYDQAKDDLESEVQVEVVNADGKSIFLSEVKPNEKVVIDIPKHSKPGTWKVKATYKSLVSKEEVTIQEVKSVDVDLVNDTLYVTNTGNVDYKDYISVELNEGDFIFTKKVSISPAETITIDLTKEAPSGQYNLRVTGAAVKPNNFDDVIIVGKNKKSFNLIYSFLLVLIIASLIFLTFLKRMHIISVRTKTNRDLKQARIKLKRIKSRKEKEGRKKRASSTFTKEESIADFKERLLRDIRETESKIRSSRQNNPYISIEPQKEEKKAETSEKGLFNMFN